MQIPDILKQFPNWLAWGPDPDNGRPKCPLMVRDRTQRASTRKKETWVDFKTASAFLKKYGGVDGWGIGFAFTAETGLVYLDIDDALNEAGELRAWCREFVEPLAGLAYMEKSPSGRGLHIITRGALPGGVIGGKRNFPEAASGLMGHDGKPRVPEVAMFTEGKYTTITGAVWGGQGVIGDGGAAAAGVWAAAGIDASRYEAQAGPAPKAEELPVVKAARVPAGVRKELASAEGAAAAEDRSTARFRLFCDLFRAGLDAEEVFSVITAPGTEGWWDVSGAAEKGRHQVWADVLRTGAKAETARREFEREQAEKKAEGEVKAAGWSDLGVPTRARMTKAGPVVEAVWGVRAMVETLHKHPHWKGRLRWNRLKEQAELDGQALGEGTSTVAEWLRSYLGWDAEPPQSLVWAALLETAHLGEYHPVSDWLRELKWDGERRIDDWLVRAGCEDGVVTRLVGRKWLISLVARALRPGCTVQTVLVLEGPQGLKKSTLFKVIAGREWFTDAHANLDRDGLMVMAGHWVVELAELASVKKAEVESVRSFITRDIDVFRAPYGRTTMTKPRQFVVVGTTNADAEGYLADTAGNRRYWPVKTERVLDLDLVAAEREQLFAEARAALEQGEHWWFDEQPQALTQAQTERQVIDPLDEKLDDVLAGVGGGPVRMPSLLEALGLASDRKDFAMRVAVMLKARGWERQMGWMSGVRTRVWAKAGSGEAEVGAATTN